MAGLEMSQSPEGGAEAILHNQEPTLEFNENAFERAVSTTQSLDDLEAVLGKHAVSVEFVDYKGENEKARSIFSEGKRHSVDKYIKHITELKKKLEVKEEIKDADFSGLPTEPTFLYDKILELVGLKGSVQ